MKKVKFKNLNFKELKIEKMRDVLGECSEAIIVKHCKPNHCFQNCFDIVSKEGLMELKNGKIIKKYFELVECAFVRKNRDEEWLDPHAIIYYNGHYFDPTLELFDYFNEYQNEIYIKTENLPIVGIRQYSEKEFRKAVTMLNGLPYTWCNGYNHINNKGFKSGITLEGHFTWAINDDVESSNSKQLANFKMMKKFWNKEQSELNIVDLRNNGRA